MRLEKFPFVDEMCDTVRRQRLALEEQQLQLQARTTPCSPPPSPHFTFTPPFQLVEAEAEYERAQLELKQTKAQQVPAARQALHSISVLLFRFNITAFPRSVVSF